MITPAFKLKAKHIIHTVAPVYARHPEPEMWRLLANCYHNSLALAARQSAGSIAFPSLGTGAFGIPIARACEVAIDEAIAHVATRRQPHQMTFCCFSDSDAAIYRRVLEDKNGR